MTAATLDAVETSSVDAPTPSHATGTLTQNQMTVPTIWLPAGPVDLTGVGYDPAGHFEVDGQRIDYRRRPDMLLTADNFSSTIGAIEEGRRQYDNTQEFVRYLLSSNTGEIVAIFINIRLGGPLILPPVQIVWMNLATDGVTAVALGLEPAEQTVMRRKPGDPRTGVLDWRGVAMIAGLGSYIGLATLALFHFYLQSGDPSRVAAAGTIAFTAIILIEKINVLNFRSLSSPLTSVGLRSNPWILAAIVSMIGLQAAAVYTPLFQKALHTVPLRLSDWGLMFAVAAPILVVTEITKTWVHRKTPC